LLGSRSPSGAASTHSAVSSRCSRAHTVPTQNKSARRACRTVTIDHLLFFHVDGDSLVAPTIFKDGKAIEFPSSNWKIAFTNNTLATYTIQLKVMPSEYLWSVSAGGVLLAEGHYLRDPSKPEYLNIYTFDNTVCYLSGLKMAK